VTGPAPAVEAVGLIKTFGPVRAVDGIDLALAPGRIYGLLGPNGSGKTTLIRLLAGLARPTSGEARILGTRMPNRPMLGRIGYMPQAEAIYPDLSVGENLRFFGALQGASGSAAIERVAALVELADRTGSPAIELSGGMRRRLSLACTLVHEPPVLFLDEPTVGVDPALRVQFWSHFRRLAAGGTTILVASHVMDEADRCDDLLFIRSGKVIAHGTGAELRTSAGTDNLETAFLHFAGLDADGRPVGGAATA
jgi:ABC-2 type transport system ATP-binding protein